MEIDRKELKNQARAAMKQATPAFWQITLVFWAMTTGVSLLLDLIPYPTDASGFSSIGLFISILFGLYSTVATFGYRLWSLWTARRLDPGIDALTQGFSVAGRVILMEINIYLRTMLVIFGTAFLIYLILFPLGGPLVILSPLISLVAAGISAAVGLAFYLRYTLAPYLLADNPDAGPAPAIRHSVNLMQGWKMELFKLELSFLGWDLLNLFLSGVVMFISFAHYGLLDISYLSSLSQLQMVYQVLQASMTTSLAIALVTLPVTLWVTPYRNVAQAYFYDARLRLQKENAPIL